MMIDAAILHLLLVMYIHDTCCASFKLVSSGKYADGVTQFPQLTINSTSVGDDVGGNWFRPSQETKLSAC